jgi:hypothetical protein
MSKNSEKAGPAVDHYKATLEDGALVMRPYCACGHALDEDYFCDPCNKKCRCREIICDNDATLGRVKDYIRKSSRFSGFRIGLDP